MRFLQLLTSGCVLWLVRSVHSLRCEVEKENLCRSGIAQKGRNDFSWNVPSWLHSAELLRDTCGDRWPSCQSESKFKHTVSQRNAGTGEFSRLWFIKNRRGGDLLRQRWCRQISNLFNLAFQRIDFRALRRVVAHVQNKLGSRLSERFPALFAVGNQIFVLCGGDIQVGNLCIGLLQFCSFLFDLSLQRVKFLRVWIQRGRHESSSEKQSHDQCGDHAIPRIGFLGGPLPLGLHFNLQTGVPGCGVYHTA